MKFPEPLKGNMWIGAVYYYYSRLTFYFSIPSLLMLFATFWHTTGSIYVQLPLYAVAIMSTIIILIVVAIEYVIITPSVTAYGNRLLKEQNPVLYEVIELRKEIKELKEMQTIWNP